MGVRVLKSKGSSVGLVAVLAMALLSCAPKGDKNYIKECILPQEQASTLSGRWPKTAIPLAFAQGQFSADEMKAITAAADTWNEFYQAVSEIPMLDYGDANSPRTSPNAKPATLCSQTIIPAGEFTGNVVIYKQTTWPYTNHDAIAITSFCPIAGNPINSIRMGVMELNYQYFFIAGRKQPDIESIFVHELGHLIGLEHSCYAGSRSGFPNCNDPGLNPDFYDAVMYPVVLFDSSGTGQVKRDIQANDQGRGNCLYGKNAM